MQSDADDRGGTHGMISLNAIEFVILTAPDGHDESGVCPPWAEQAVQLLQGAEKALRIFADRRNFEGCGGCLGWGVDDVTPMEVAQAALNGQTVPEIKLVTNQSGFTWPRRI